MADPREPDRAARRHAVERRRRLIILGSVLAVAVVALVVVLLVSNGSDDDSKQADNAGTTSDGSTTANSGAGSTAEAPKESTTTTNDATPLPGGVCRGGQLEGQQTSSGLTGDIQTGVFVFTNTSTTACKVNGSAAVTLLDANGTSLPTVVTTGGGAVPPELVAQDVNLDPGAQASMLASWDPIGDGSDASCSSAAAASFVMPASKGAVKVDTRMKVCLGGALNISPMQPGVIAG